MWEVEWTSENEALRTGSNVAAPEAVLASTLTDPDMTSLRVTSADEGAGGVMPQGFVATAAMDTDEVASQASTTEHSRASGPASNEEVSRFIRSIDVDSDEIRAAQVSRSA